jgi:capsule polysaccharide export protein KpsE/RkpR
VTEDQNLFEDQDPSEGWSKASPQPDHERRIRAEDTLWSAIGVLYRRRRFIIGMSMLVAIASIIISLLLPKWYQATARVLLPVSGSSGGGLTAMLGDLGPAASALLGISGGDYIRYMAILNSRTVLEKMIEEFDLMTVYETTDSQAPMESTLEALGSNFMTEVDMEYDYLAVSVLDQDPNRAAEMANFAVGLLNELNARLMSENATNYRRFIEHRYYEIEADLDTARTKFQHLQEKHGVFEITTQAQAFLEMVAQYRAFMLQGEIELNALRTEFGTENNTVQSAQKRVDAAEQKMNELLAGRDVLMPVPLKRVPEIGREYAEVLQEVLIQEKIIEFARPLLEQARLEEERESPAVQILDLARVPELKAKPKRSIIVIAATFSGFMLIVIYVLAHAWWRQNQDYIIDRLQGADVVSK